MIERFFNHGFRISSCRIKGGKKDQSIVCGPTKSPRTTVKLCPVDCDRRDSVVFDMALLEDAVLEFVSIQKDVLALKRVIFEFHDLSVSR